MDKYTCNKCGSHKVKLEKRGNQTALLCADCGAWIKWVGRKEIEHVKEYISTDTDNIKEECESFEFVIKAVGLIEKNLKEHDRADLLSELAEMNSESVIKTVEDLVYALEAL